MIILVVAGNFIFMSNIIVQYLQWHFVGQVKAILRAFSRGKDLVFKEVVNKIHVYLS